MKKAKDIYKFDEKNHIHTLDDKPLTGTSSIGNVLAKGGLVWWASGKACEVMGWVYPNIKENGKIIGKVPVEDRLKVSESIHLAITNDTPEEYLARLDIAYKAHATHLKDSAKKGTDLHAILERFVKEDMERKNIVPLSEEETWLIEPFIDWSRKNVKKFLASEAHCYSKELWVGGIVDAVAELNDGTIAVIDFKSSREAYITQFLQASGYAIQIDENGLFSEDGNHNKRIDKIGALIVVPFGAEIIKPEIRKQIEEYKKGFECAVELYRLLDLDNLINNKK